MSNTNNNLQTQISNGLHNATMEAGGKDCPPMVAPGNYVQWKSRIKRYIDTKPNNELIHYCLLNPPYKFKWAERTIPIADGSSETTIEGYMENYKNVSQYTRNQSDAKAEAVQIILTGIDNDIYSTVDACPNAYEMDGETLESYYSRFYKMMNELVRNQCDVTNHQVNVQFLLQLKPEWQRFVPLVKQSQELKTVSYHKLYDILKQHQNEVNEIRAERLALTANLLALVAQQQPVYHPQNHPTHYTQNSSARPQQAAITNKGKAIVNSPSPTYDQEPEMVAEDDALECQKPKWAKDAAYHKEKMLLYKQEEAEFQLNAEQADCRNETDDEPEDQELEAHYLYTWTHFLRSKDETPEVLIDFFKLVQRGLHAQIRTIQTDKSMEFLNKTLHACFAQEGIEHQTLTARTPEQNGIAERRNCTLFEAARTMLSAAKVPLDGENLDKMKEKAKTVTTSNELDLLFSPMFNELLNGTTTVVSKYSAVHIADAPNQRQQQNTTPSTSTIVAINTPPLNIQTTPETTSQAPTQALIVTTIENIN
ncbi:hypothetical protein Tco_0768522 [Tanacetum coccineum]